MPVCAATGYILNDDDIFLDRSTCALPTVYALVLFDVINQLAWAERDVAKHATLSWHVSLRNPSLGRGMSLVAGFIIVVSLPTLDVFNWPSPPIINLKMNVWNC